MILRGLRAVAAVAVSVSLWAGPALVAAAHTEFDHSSPEDGESVAGPVTEVEIVFTLPVRVVGSGFEVLDPVGEVVVPTVETDDDASFHLVLPTAIEDGIVGVRYEVTAEDGHVLTGAFSFDVATSPEMATTTTVEVTTTTSGVDTTTHTMGPITTPAGAGTLVAAGEDGEVSPMLAVALALLVGLGLYALARRARKPGS